MLARPWLLFKKFVAACVVLNSFICIEIETIGECNLLFARNSKEMLCRIECGCDFL